MSFHLIPSTRRQMLTATASVGAVAAMTLLGPFESQAAESGVESDPNFWALIADTHISEDASAVSRGVNMFDNFNRVIDSVLAETVRPVGAIINGDCAYLKGKPGDYANFKRCVDRLLAAGMSVHATMGNHDDRGNFYDAMSGGKAGETLVEGKHVTVIETSHANLFLVDSLQQVDHVTGELGSAQLDWLNAALAARSGKLAIIVGHHNPQVSPVEPGKLLTGLADTAALFDTMDRHSNVKAYVYGHTHDWKLTTTPGGTHLVNQPPSAYVFNPARPSGWTRLRLSPAAVQFQLVSVDTLHPQHGEQLQLAYASKAGTTLP
ncbi:metallophosphoesterase family protein [Rubripirellula reticaptiva]|uniref:3',5'-cyclic adenosine monophosphate phosphodiesterase CpdA n=1 Tax=Rubripirellula reticaptiva TaxID=2528013 RepID=A0A5C6FBN0_9BACT|nr:metallophosphoesterase [Rubripirellula reticaptiva]TWU57536.1 3',5'-cyclic adenosine monophosphate phosphodiesterase CpdA [Rubripirellula reticaptiva]